MDIKAKIEEVLDKAKNDEVFHKELKSNPIKAVEDLVGVDLPDEQIKAVVDGVKEKLLDATKTNIIGELEGKLEGLFHKS